MTLHLLLAFLLVLGMGFAAHRASLCTVKAVAEVMTSGQAWMLASFVKAVLWTLLLSGTLIVMLSITPQPVLGRLPWLAALAGGFAFGVGAAINGGCSFSTLQRLADGELDMALTLLGMALGFVGMVYLISGIDKTSLQPIVPDWHWQNSSAAVLLGALWLWALWELSRLWRTRNPAGGLFHHLLASKYRLSSGAALLGIGGGTLYALHGAWTYTNFLRAESASWLGAGPTPAVGQTLLLVALITGMLLSSWHRGTLAIRPPNPRKAGPHLLGGFLMGVGGTLAPGGNDTLLLAAIPTFSLQAVTVYGALLAGVAFTLAAMHWKAGTAMRVECSGDRCP